MEELTQQLCRQSSRLFQHDPSCKHVLKIVLYKRFWWTKTLMHVLRIFMSDDKVLFVTKFHVCFKFYLCESTSLGFYEPTLALLAVVFPPRSVISDVQIRKRAAHEGGHNIFLGKKYRLGDIPLKLEFPYLFYLCGDKKCLVSDC